jgi:hypothetical protein
VKGTDKSIQWAEKNLKHKWVPLLKENAPKSHPMDYFVPNFGIDEDIATTQSHIAEQEQLLNH